MVDSTFTVGGHMPPEWDYMETYVPINENGGTHWTRVRVERSAQGGTETKTIEVEGNRQESPELIHLAP